MTNFDAPMPAALALGNKVLCQGYEFEVVEYQGSAIAPDGKLTHYYLGKVTSDSRNDSIRYTGFARGNYSFRSFR
jgi:hypothetical protein